LEERQVTAFYRYLFDSRQGSEDHFLARWLFLRALAVIYFSAFFALIFQIQGLIGPKGILPATEFLASARGAEILRFWYIPSLLWISNGDSMLKAVCWTGLIASLLLLINISPRVTLSICFLCFLSFVSAAQDFSGYQSDGMLLEAGFLSLFLAPSGVFPGLGRKQRPVRAVMFLLLWEWFRIYFESGVVKLESGDPTWRNLTAMYEYYQNGPLPTWIGWYLQHLPYWFHRATAGLTLGMELVLVWIAFLPRRWRIACFFIVTVWQIGVIATANYAFLNYLVLILAVWLLDDEFLRGCVPSRCHQFLPQGVIKECIAGSRDTNSENEEPPTPVPPNLFASFQTAFVAIIMTWIFYTTSVPLAWMFWRGAPLPTTPMAVIEPFRIANQYGLFAVMTPHRYEIEFQGSNDGEQWLAYPFRYKPQELNQRPFIYAPYQPRFDWNLWFASLGTWQQNVIVPRTEELLLENDPEVLGLFAGNPFTTAPPRLIRAVLWQYWFSTREEKRLQGVWWRRQYLGTYAPTLTRLPDGQFGIVSEATLSGPRNPEANGPLL
jgi:lipase maturation factor 1